MATTPLDTLIGHLQVADCYPHAVSTFEVFETHISYVILTGEFAYKFKKPVDLGFLDFTTLEKRKYFCEEELRLNRRLAADMYLEVVNVNGTLQQPVINGPGPILEYAVKMRQFATRDRMDKLTARGDLTSAHIDQLAQILADFHGRIPVAAEQSPFGTFEVIQQRITQNFEQVLQNTTEPDIREMCVQLQDWSETALMNHQEFIAQRKQEGAVRECHGDMHMANIVIIADKPLIYDCLEFAEDLRWIDTMSEVAFLYMDLDYHHQHRLALRLLNQYLSLRGDYAGLGMLCLYLVYRAMVRAKVSSIGAMQQQAKSQIAAELLATTKNYLALGRNYIESFASPMLIILHGLSGCGKTWLAEALRESYGAIHIRSDIERKRLLGLDALARTKSSVGQGAYTEDMTTQTYERLLELAKLVLQAGPSVIVDATFLQQSQREQFQQMARSQAVPFLILDLQASEDTLRSRIKMRNAQAKDASEATLDVLQNQINKDEAITGAEKSCTIRLDMDSRLDMAELVEQIKQYKRDSMTT